VPLAGGTGMLQSKFGERRFGTACLKAPRRIGTLPKRIGKCPPRVGSAGAPPSAGVDVKTGEIYLWQIFLLI